MTYSKLSEQLNRIYNNTNVLHSKQDTILKNIRHAIEQLHQGYDRTGLSRDKIIKNINHWSIELRRITN